MPELGFLDQPSATSAFTPRHSSPDSVFSTLDSNFTLFSSASANVDPCSFITYHAHHQNHPASDISPHLAGHEQQESSSGPDLDPSPNPNNATMHIKHSRLSRKGEKAKVQKEGNKADTDEPLDSARSSFSVALKECQDRRSRSEALLKKPDRRRPASLDLNNATASSPRLGAMKKSSVSARKSGTFPSPATPYCRQASAGMQKGWSSERVPLHINANRNNLSTAATLPYNNGRTLPSKWEDAERWIFSPVSGDSGARPSLAQPYRRPKSKSGPLGPPGIAYYSLYSPVVPMFDGVNMGNSVAGSPFSAGVIAANGLTFRSVGCNGAFPAYIEPCMARSVSVHGCSEMPNQVSLPHSLDRAKDSGTNVSRVVSRRDMATQMSPVGSTNPSPKGRISFSASNPSALSIVELQSDQSSKLEVRDVQVDERITVTRWSRKHRARVPGKGENVDEWKQKAVNAQPPAWNITDTSKSLSKENREEAKIIAWENLQKAKAEAAIRKLEMKLEKKRSSSMDKIMNKLRSAQKKAQKMRSSVTTNQTHEAVLGKSGWKGMANVEWSPRG